MKRASASWLVGLLCLATSATALANIEMRKNGSRWGSASNCCGDHGSKRAVAAVLVFFSDYF